MQEQKRLIALNPRFGGNSEIIDNLKVNRYGKYLSRLNIESELANALKNDNYITLVYGNGGTGKSSLVYNLMLKIISKKEVLGYDLDKIFWFSDADNPGSLNIEKVINEIEYSCNLSGSTSTYSSIEERISEVSKLFSTSKKSIIVLDNFETVNDKKLIDFILCGLPKECKVVLTSKYGLKKLEEKELIGERFIDSVNQLHVPKFTLVEWQEVFHDKCSISTTLDEWTKRISEDNLQLILSEIYEKLEGNIFGMTSIVSQISSSRIYDFNRIMEILRKEKLYKKAFSRILEDSWKMLTRKSKEILIAAMLQGLVYIDFNFLTSVSEVSGFEKNEIIFLSELDDAINECLDLDLMQVETVGNKEFYYIGPLVYRFLYSLFYTEHRENFDKITINWIEYHKKEAVRIGFCYNDTSKLKVLDEPSKRNALMMVLDYCYKEEKYSDFIEISKNLRYYFYTRGIWSTNSDCVHLRRANAAHEINDAHEEFEALVYYVNIAAKYNQLNNLEQHINRLENICKSVQIDNEAFFRYKHVLGLYYYAKKEFNLALNQWNEILNSDDKISHNVHDVDAAKRWRLKCLMEHTDSDPQTIIDNCLSLLDDAKNHNFERSILDYSLIIVDEALKKNDLQTAKDLLKDIEELVYMVNDLLYLARYCFLNAMCLGDTEQGIEFIDLAIEHYKELGVPHEIEKFKSRIIGHKVFLERFNKFLYDRGDTN